MAVITSADWTMTVEERSIWGKKKRNRIKLVWEQNNGFYPSSGGVPLPTTMGMVRNIDYVIMVQPPMPTTVAAGLENNFLWTYDKENHSIHGYIPPTGSPSSVLPVTGFQEFPTTWAVSLGFGDGILPVMYVEAVGW